MYGKSTYSSMPNTRWSKLSNSLIKSKKVSDSTVKSATLLKKKIEYITQKIVVLKYKKK